MASNVGFVAKVFGLAAGLALLIKGVGPLLTIPDPAVVSGVLVVLPSLVMGVILAWRAQHN
ncbi:hypothetical protein C7271_02805 [filamentous cyanobacterium CCP5]|nr:hypothetical protein C7271_02805 [filamentous cyanobacterium CCP5]